MSNEPDEEDLRKLKDKVDQFVTEDNQAKELKAKKAQAENEKINKAKERRQRWYDGYRAQSVNAARVVWDWYCEVIASVKFTETIKSLKNTHSRHLRISKTIECAPPHPWDPNQSWGERQAMSIALSDNKLFVHNIVKYGKSHEIKGSPDLLEHVEPPILIEIAETITKKTIWDIIEIK